MATCCLIFGASTDSFVFSASSRLCSFFRGLDRSGGILEIKNTQIVFCSFECTMLIPGLLPRLSRMVRASDYTTLAAWPAYDVSRGAGEGAGAG